MPKNQENEESAGVGNAALLGEVKKKKGNFEIFSIKGTLQDRRKIVQTGPSLLNLF